MPNYQGYEIFSKGLIGVEVTMQFTTQEIAKQFIRDNIEEIKTFELPGKNGILRPFFNLYMDPAQWTVYTTSRLLAKAMIARSLSASHQIVQEKGHN